MPSEAVRNDALAGFEVSRETRDRLTVLAREIGRWQAAVNLVGSRTIHDLWSRHIADSLQLATLTDRRSWLDLGSGAGFPGLVVAAANPDLDVTLVESDGRKCAFLRHASREMGLSVRVIEGRIETMDQLRSRDAAVVTARALASLDQLLRYGEPWLARGGIGLFPKGRNHLAELTQARESWRFDADVIPSRTDPDARIIRVANLMGR